MRFQSQLENQFKQFFMKCIFKVKFKEPRKFEVLQILYVASRAEKGDSHIFFLLQFLLSTGICKLWNLQTRS